MATIDHLTPTFLAYNIGFAVGGIGICVYILWFIENRLDKFMEKNIDPLIASYNKRVKAADERRSARKEKKRLKKLEKQTQKDLNFLD